ncbi:unnamed protein product [Umbelopsis vinacea]
MFSSSFKQHLTDLSPLQHFARSKSFYQPEECKFACDEVSYLGYIIGPADLKTDPAKVSAVLVSHPPRIKTPYVPSSVSPRVWMLSRLIIPQSLSLPVDVAIRQMKCLRNDNSAIRIQRLYQDRGNLLPLYDVTLNLATMGLMDDVFEDFQTIKVIYKIDPEKVEKAKDPTSSFKRTKILIKESKKELLVLCCFAFDRTSKWSTFLT